MLRPPPSSNLFPYTTLFRSSGLWMGVNPAFVQTGNVRISGDKRATLNIVGATELYRQWFSVARLSPEMRSEEHTSELQSGSISYAVFCLKKKNIIYMTDI